MCDDGSENKRSAQWTHTHALAESPFSVAELRRGGGGHLAKETFSHTSSDAKITRDDDCFERTKGDANAANVNDSSDAEEKMDRHFSAWRGINNRSMIIDERLILSRDDNGSNN